MRSLTSPRVPPACVLPVQEWSAEEVAQGLHGPSMKFAMESRSQRGYRAGSGKMSAAALSATHGMPNSAGSDSEVSPKKLDEESAVKPANKAYTCLRAWDAIVFVSRVCCVPHQHLRHGPVWGHCTG